MRSWVKWGLPVSVLALLAGGGGGVLLAETYYREPARPQAEQGEDVAQSVESPEGVVYMPGALEHPDQREVQRLLDDHFRSINTRNYDLWKSTVVRSKWDELPKAKWLTAYGTTDDLDIAVHRIDPGPDGSLLALLTFKSYQTPDAAPPDMPVGCLDWNLVYPMVVDESGKSLRLDTSKLPNSALRKPCAG
ncbi:hypothetical protein [Saccharopolyspora oryzae]|uniref:Uncharacterized protein n=1 Tax=Saccharopolyspora oryzae TaxID=2997343 RepID=A0ABT4V6C1_9PSEU|nr:hypothetical protein [Saccharopolyspora oryzae]MDA3629520.1 hypothetical protein [Saccharopolyspora oryzae]